MTIEEHIQYWRDSAEDDLPVAESLFKNGHYAWSLFIGHLVLEKILKAHYVRAHQKNPPKIHDLVRLAESAKLEISQEQKKFLFLVNTFHLEARYPDYKLKMHKLCTRSFTEKQLHEIREMYQWLKSQLPSGKR